MSTRLNVRCLRSFLGLAVGVATILTVVQDARGQVAYELLHAFAIAGSTPSAPLIQASDGNFYGTTMQGGAFTGGTVFKMTAAGALTTLGSFDCGDGCNPVAGLIQASDGNFYGTAQSGSYIGCGSVFKITAAGTLTTLHTFLNDDGCNPAAGLIQAGNGNFYGTTPSGGAAGGGTVFKITAAGALTTLHSFDCTIESCQPQAGLIQATDGTFYGTTSFGGSVFKLTAAGALTTLHSFDCTDGCLPVAGLIQASDGNFYGTTKSGGAVGGGTVFKITAAGTLTTLHSFDCSNVDGCTPLGGLIQASDGNFYGTTNDGDVTRGTFFKLTGAGGTFTTLHSFDCSIEGCRPVASLIQASDGNFYSTTPVGGGVGSVFKITAAGTPTTLHSFGGCGTDGCAPYGGLIQASDGNFYGTTSNGGAAGFGSLGSVFKLTAAGALTTLHTFDSTDGSLPVAGLIQASDGNFYGTTSSGGAGRGTVFTITAEGTLTMLHSFNCKTEGCAPTAGLVQASDGNFYGTTEIGGAAGGGTVFTITAAGIFTTLHAFDCAIDGCNPHAGLVQASDGDLYGTTKNGGASRSGGTIFKITPAGTLTTLYFFDCNIPEGCSPYAGLIQASDGNFYGATAFSGAGGRGTLFKITATGTLTTLHSFSCNADGGVPSASLIQASDGNFYGTTQDCGLSGGGISGGGTVFKLTAGGTFTTLHSFDCKIDGCNSFAGVIQASDGNLYGTAPFDGPQGAGVLFRLVPLSYLRVWIGLKNSDDVGVRLDLLAEIFLDRTKIGEGRLNNVSAGSSGFNNAVLSALSLDRTGGPVGFPGGLALDVRVSVRRSCSGEGHASGTARLWYNGQPIDTGSKKDAASRFDAVSDLVTVSHFLRAGFSLSPGAGTSRQSIDVSVDSKQPCPDRTFKSFGTWSKNPT